MYRVAHNKLDYLLLLSQLYISTTEHISMIMYVQHKKIIVKEVFSVSSTDCNNERQSFAEVSYSAIDNVLTNLLPVGSQDFFQVFNISNVPMTVNKLLECFPD